MILIPILALLAAISSIDESQIIIPESEYAGDGLVDPLFYKKYVEYEGCYWYPILLQHCEYCPTCAYSSQEY